ncbi:hypothetical protein JXB37_00005 [candidate division WOR-3 bacterium]|nr:hypothetical protein [candidate division WOR-3 bacterium]
MRIAFGVALVLALAAGQGYVLEAKVIDGGGRRLSSAGYACGLSAGQAVASGWLQSAGFRAVLGFWNRPLSVIGIEEPGPGLEQVERAWLGPCSPNPVRGRAALRYGLPRECDVRLEVFDHAGRSVGTLLEQRQAAGSYRLSWDIGRVGARELPNGVYFLRLSAGCERLVEKAVVAR